MRYVWQLVEEKDRPVLTVSPEKSALDAAHLLDTHHIGALVVVRDEQIVGIISERDILRRVVVRQRDPARTSVAEIMTSPVRTCSLQDTLDEVRTVIRNERIRHVPVVDSGRIAGIISIGDLNLVTERTQAETILYLEQYMYQP